MMKNSTEDYLKPLKLSKILNAFLTFFTNGLNSSLLVILFLFFISKVFIIQNIKLFVIVSLVLIFVYFLVKFSLSISSLFKRTWALDLIHDLKGANKEDKDKLLNMYDLAIAGKLSLNESLYLKQLENSIQIEKDEISYFKYLKKPLVIVSLCFVLSLVDNEFKNYISYNFFSIKEKNEFFVKLNEKRLVKLAIDSAKQIEFTHNIPGLNKMSLYIQSDYGIGKIKTLSTSVTAFQFMYPEIKKGSLFLKANSSLIGECFSDTLFFEFIDAITIKNHQVQIDYPNYTRLPTVTVNNIYDIKVLKGSKISWELDLNKRVYIESSNFSVKDSLNLIFDKRIYKRNDYFSVMLRDNEQQIIEFKSDTFSLIIDQKPVVLIRSPEKTSKKANMDPISLVLAAFDDFGFSKIDLQYFYENKQLALKSEYTVNRLLNNEPKSFIKQVDWDISSTNLFPGMDLYFRVIAYDNNAVDGNQKAETEWFHVHFLTLEEMYQELNQDQENLQKEIVSQIDERREISKKIEELYLKAKQKGKLSENDNKELNSLVEKLEKLNQKLRDTEKNLNKIEKQMTEDKLFNEETVSKFNQIKQLMEELKSFLKQNPVKKDISNSSSDVKKELKDFANKEKDIQEQLERMRSLLNKLKEKQQTDLALKKIQEFKKEQDKINEDSKSNSSKEKQENLKKKVDQFINKKAEKKIDKKAQDLVKEEKVSERMKKQAENPDAKQGKELSESLKKIEESLKEEIQKQESKEKKNFLDEIDRIVYRLIQLSITVETLSEKSNTISAYSSKYRDIAKEQNLLNQKIEYLKRESKKLSNESFLFNPKIPEVLQTAADKNNTAIASLEQRQSKIAYNNQIEAMGLINQSILMLDQTKNSMKNAKTALGEEEFQKMMQQMSQNQQGLNSQSESLWDMLKQQASSGKTDQKLSGKEKLGDGGEKRDGQSSEESGGEANGESLGKQQSDLAKQLQSLLDKLGDQEGRGKGKSGRLSEMIEEMKKISKELDKNKINEELIKRQRKLLKKMLDAASAGKEKDQEKKKREKEMAKEFSIEDIKKLRSDYGENDIYLQEQLEKAMRENFDPTIKKLIQHYYNSLINLKTDSLKKSK
jgi:hypothetical protein